VCVKLASIVLYVVEWKSYIRFVQGLAPSQRSSSKSYVTSGLSEPWSLNQFKSLRARSSYENDVPANRISRRENLCITVTSFPTHTQCKKLKFSETALSFAVKVKFSTFVCIFRCEILAGNAHVSYRLTAVNLTPGWLKWNFSLHYHYLFKHSSGEDKESGHQGWGGLDI